MLSSTHIDGEKVFLLPISDKDTERIVKWRNQPEISGWFLDRRPFTAESHRKWLSEYVDTARAVQWIIYEKVSSEPIGTVYLRDIDHINLKCEFGIYIGELSKSGYGYGREAVCLVTDYALYTLNLKKVYLRIMRGNEKSINCCKAAGYVVEGISRMDRWIAGNPIDVMFMAKYA